MLLKVGGIVYKVLFLKKFHTLNLSLENNSCIIIINWMKVAVTWMLVIKPQKFCGMLQKMYCVKSVILFTRFYRLVAGK